VTTHEYGVSFHTIYSGPLAHRLLTDLFNAIATTGHIPGAFQFGYVTPIPKSPDKGHTNPSNYQGIAILSDTSKLLRRSSILSKLQSSRLQLNPLQGSFRLGFSSTHTALFCKRLYNPLGKAEEKHTYIAFLDVKKAFGTVWH